MKIIFFLLILNENLLDLLNFCYFERITLDLLKWRVFLMKLYSKFNIRSVLFFLSFHWRYFASAWTLIQMRSEMTFPHVGQSSLFFIMFVLLDNVQKLHTQFLKFLPPPFFMALEVFKYKNMNLKTRKED
jgi:hypothetical protein